MHLLKCLTLGVHINCRGAILFWGNFSFCLRVFGRRNALRVYSLHKQCINMQIYV